MAASAEQSLFVNPRGGKRTDDWSAAAHPFRVHELFQRVFEARIRFADTIRILDNRLAVGKQTRDCESHCDAMIAKAGYPRAMQWRGTVNFKTVLHLDHLSA